jgi:hypothetical protein
MYSSASAILGATRGSTSSNTASHASASGHADMTPSTTGTRVSSVSGTCPGAARAVSASVSRASSECIVVVAEIRGGAGAAALCPCRSASDRVIRMLHCTRL